MNDIDIDENPRSSRFGFLRKCIGISAADQRNQLRFAIGIIFWALTMAVSPILIELEVVNLQFASWLAAALPLITFLFVLYSYTKFLRETDELARQIQYEGLAFGFAVCMIFVMSAELREMIGLGDFDAETPIVVLMFGAVAGQFLSAWRYR